MGGDVVGVGENQFVIAVVILHGHFHGGGLVLPLHARPGEVQGLGLQQFLILIEILDEFPDAALVAEALTPVGPHPLVGKGDAKTRIQERQLPKPQPQGVVAVLQRIEDIRIGPEVDGGAGLRNTLFRHMHAVQGDAPGIVLHIELAVSANLYLQLFGQGVDAGKAHAVQTPRDLIAPAAELAAGVEDGQGHLQGVLAGLLVIAHGNATAVVPDGDGVALVQKHLDMGAVAGHGLVHAVVHDFRHQLVQTPFVRGADVHARAAAHRLQPFQHLDLGSIIASGYFVANVFCHCFSSSLLQ